MAITIECGQAAVKLIAEDIEGTADVGFPKPGTKGGITQAEAEKKAGTDAETKAEENAKADITRQQNEVKCGGKGCKKDTPPPTSAVSVKGTATSTLNGDRSGTAHGTAKATGHGTVQCKPGG